MNYRRDIDGLRAVAVLPVILYHAEFAFWSGGYIGGDLFFVSSGYLITSILIEERARGTYSVLHFYERRARRILPALLVMLLACLPFAWLWMPPDPFADFAESLAYTALFISNAHFMGDGGYFDPEAALRPLIHTWSLAVEEQFYLLFPLFLLALGRFRTRKYLIGFILLALFSLGLAEWGARNYPDRNFYFTPSRLWELLAGSLCAVILFRRSPMRGEVPAAIGLTLIVAATVLFDSTIPFPAVYTLVPVLGTCLIILFAAPETWTARVLSVRPMVGIGLISYSAYLWHQPVFAFARIRLAEAPGDALMLAFIALALVLAWLSWRFIEQPVRGRAPLVLPARRSLLMASGIGIVLFAGVGFWGAVDGAGSRFDPGKSVFLERLYNQTTYHETAKTVCVRDGEPRSTEICVAYEVEAPRRRIALWGDSHARMILPAFADVANALEARILFADEPGCPPLLGVWLMNGGQKARNCRKSVDEFLKAARAHEVDTVVMVARWSAYATGDYRGGAAGSAVATEPAFPFQSADERLAAFESGLARTLSHFEEAGIGVIVVSQVPQQEVSPQRLVQAAILRGMDDVSARLFFQSSFVRQEQSDRLQAPAQTVLARRADLHDAQLLQLDEAFVGNDRYVWLDGDNALYTDDDHISQHGAARLAPRFIEVLEQR